MAALCSGEIVRKLGNMVKSVSFSNQFSSIPLRAAMYFFEIERELEARGMKMMELIPTQGGGGRRKIKRTKRKLSKKRNLKKNKTRRRRSRKR